MEHGTIIREANGHYPFHFWIQKAIARDEMGKMVVEGIASTLNVDHDKERMSLDALKSMVSIINKDGVPLRVEHSQNDNAIIGNINKAWLDERNQMWIKAILDESHPASGILYKGLKEGVKMGLSVGGYVKRATQELVEGLGRQVNTFYDVLLDEVSVTQKPSNYDARLMAKSFAKSEGEVDALANAFESSEFLFNSAMGGCDYLQAISKSIKESDWKDVSKDYKLDINKDMDNKETEDKTTKAAEETETKTTKGGEETDEKTTKTKEETDEKTEKSVSRTEFNEFVKFMSEGLNGLTKAFGKMSKAMDSSPMVQNHPDDAMTDPEDVPEKKVDKASGGEAVDERQPTKPKRDPEEGKTVSKKGTPANGTDETGEREEKAKGDKDDTYDMETVERAVKAIRALNKKMDETDEEKTTKADKETETETKVSKSVKVSSIDAFVVETANAIERLEKSMREGGFQTDHVAKTVINSIRSNPEFRKDIAHFMKEAGPKRSVVSGTPFVKTKDGRMFALSLNEQGDRTEKSAKEVPTGPGAFKSVWGSSFSSTVKE